MSVDRVRKDAAEVCVEEVYAGLDALDDYDLWVKACRALRVLVSELEAAQKERDELEALLRRLSEWDALTVADQWPLGDGPYWKAEIARVLAAVSGVAAPTEKEER